MTAERHRFRQLRQHDGESVTAFVGRLREKVDTCEFESTAVDTVPNCQVRDQFIAGLKSTAIRVELLKEDKLTLAVAVTKAVALEASVSDCKLYEENCHPRPTVDPVAAVVPVSGYPPAHLRRVVSTRVDVASASTAVEPIPKASSTAQPLTSNVASAVRQAISRLSACLGRMK